MLKKIPKSLIVFFACLIACLLMLIILVQGGQLVLIFLGTTLNVGQFSIRFWTQLYYVLAGMAWLTMMFMVYFIFDRAAKKGMLLSSALNGIGIILLIMALLEAALIAYGYLPKSSSQIGLTCLEFLISLGMIYLGQRKKMQLAHS